MSIRKMVLMVLMFGALVLNSCTKIVDVNTGKDVQKYVVEGIITEGQNKHLVRVTKTLDLDQDVDMPVVDNAVVILTDELGTSEVLVGVGQGYYELNNFTPVAGVKYSLSVTVDDETFTASSTIPTVVTLDSLEILEVVSFGFSNFNSLIPKYNDVVGVKSYYQFEVDLNGEKQKGIYLMDDKYSDGKTNEQPLFSSSMEYGETYTVRMYCIDEATFKYFSALSSNSSSTPANPVSNFGKQCLGYFSARSESEQTITYNQ